MTMTTTTTTYPHVIAFHLDSVEIWEALGCPQTWGQAAQAARRAAWGEDRREALLSAAYSACTREQRDRGIAHSARSRARSWLLAEPLVESGVAALRDRLLSWSGSRSEFDAVAADSAATVNLELEYTRRALDLRDHGEPIYRRWHRRIVRSAVLYARSACACRWRALVAAGMPHHEADLAASEEMWGCIEHLCQVLDEARA